ncbi:MAG: class I SAM-dependent methyltransferase [Bermanella sp.]
MSRQSLNLTPELYQYLLASSSRESDLLKELRIETAADPMARMQISSEQGQFMGLLTRLIGARNIIEVGTFTGYSSICMAQNMTLPGQLICCDMSEVWTAVAQKYWVQAGVDHICSLRLAPAMETLNYLLKEGRARSFDMAFIDADKENYILYYEACLRLIRPGGLILIDNTLWSGQVCDARFMDEDTQAIRELNLKLKNDKRIELSMLPVGDGLTLCLKR